MTVFFTIVNKHMVDCPRHLYCCVIDNIELICWLFMSGLLHLTQQEKEGRMPIYQCLSSSFQMYHIIKQKLMYLS